MVLLDWLVLDARKIGRNLELQCVIAVKRGKEYLAMFADIIKEAISSVIAPCAWVIGVRETFADPR